MRPGVERGCVLKRRPALPAAKKESVPLVNGGNSRLDWIDAFTAHRIDCFFEE